MLLLNLFWRLAIPAFILHKPSLWLSAVILLWQHFLGWPFLLHFEHSLSQAGQLFFLASALGDLPCSFLLQYLGLSLLVHWIEGSQTLASPLILATNNLSLSSLSCAMNLIATMLNKLLWLGTAILFISVSLTLGSQVCFLPSIMGTQLHQRGHNVGGQHQCRCVVESVCLTALSLRPPGHLHYTFTHLQCTPNPGMMTEWMNEFIKSD